MSVARTINIRLLSNKIFSDLIFEFEGQRWIFGKNNMIQTLCLNDVDDFDFMGFSDFKEVKKIFDKREKDGVFNNLILWDTKTEESLILMNKTKKDKYNNYKYHYNLSITFDGFKRITGADRYTDYGFYINDLLPGLIDLGCYICEVECHDFDC